MPPGPNTPHFASELLFTKAIFSPFALAMLALILFLLLWLPRVQVTFPLVVLLCFVPYTQRFYLGGVNLDFMRVVCLVGWVRVWWRREKWEGAFTALDKLILLHAVVSIGAAGLLFQTGQAVLLATARAFTQAGFYFLIRRWVRNWDDIARLARYFGLALIPLSVLFVFEWITRSSPFAQVYPDLLLTQAREGRYRCLGAFPHAILAGAFMACLLPLLAERYWERDRRGLGRISAFFSVVSSLFIIQTTASSTPLLAVGASVFGFLMFPFRALAPFLPAMAALSALTLHQVMKKPVWSLVSRVSLVGGSTAYYRFLLIDAAIKHFPEWWLYGLRSTDHWGPGLFDLTNQYIFEGVNGGLGRLLAFLAILFAAFRSLERKLRLEQGDRLASRRTWSLWVMLFAHCVVFLGVSYYGQSTQFLFLTFAIIGSHTAGTSVAVRRHMRRRQPRQVADATQPPGSVSVA